MTLPAVTMVEVHFPERDEPDPHLLVFAVLDNGQREVLEAVPIGPFPDWEAICRRVIRHTMRARVGLMY